MVASRKIGGVVYPDGAVDDTPYVEPASTQDPMKVDAPRPYSQSLHNHQGLQTYQNNAVTTTSAPIAHQTAISAYAYIIADPGNSDYVKVGAQGSEYIRLNAGDSMPVFDVSPSMVWCIANSSTQTVQFVGFGRYR